MKATLTTRMARLEARNPSEVYPILSDEELSRGLALIRAVKDCKKSGRTATDEGLAEMLGWSVDEVKATSAQCLSIADNLEEQERL
ncbi:hypothetical protein AMST5_02804 [freshwater sediment metagenome]|uniref:Uncharacterized protein n=1 Tax=freshwater sediment metagenome TaxID=556182 RepID=A0AA48M0Q7_9ZZZZ